MSCLALFEGRELWIGTEDAGLWRFDFDEKKASKLPGWGRSKIHDLHKDTEGNIWVLSIEKGISRANRRFEFLPGRPGNVQALLAARDGTLWAGTSEGLFACRPQTDGTATFVQYMANLKLNVLSLFEDGNGNLLVGTFGQGLYCFHPASGRVRRFTEKDGLTNDNILSMDGTDGRIWLATLGGVTELLAGNSNLLTGTFGVKNFNQESGLGTNFIYKVFVDSKKRTWFGTDGKGISVLDGGAIHNFSEVEVNGEAAPLKAVYAIAEDRAGHIWIGTASQGVFGFDGETFRPLDLKRGIQGQAITNLMADANGQILLFGAGSIGLLSPQAKHLTYFGEESGIRITDLELNVVSADHASRIWVAADGGFIRYTPLLEKNRQHPSVLITGVSVFLEPVAFRSDHVFSHDQNNLVFDYVGLWYTHPAAVKYRYQVEGYDLDWIETRDRRATYSNLPTGNYIFKVTATENETWSDEPVVQWHFTIKSPLWQRWWFILLGTASAGALFYFYLKTRDQRRERVHRLEKEKVESELAAIKAQINPHFLFNSLNTLINVIEEDPHLAVGYVEKLSDFYRTVLQARDRELIPLHEEVQLVAHFGHLLQQRYLRSFHLDIRLDGLAGRVAPLALQVLVENAIKHNVVSKSKPLSVEIWMENGYIVVANNLQPKTAPEQSTRFGLSSIIRRYELLTEKKVTVQKTESHFIVHLPLLE